MKKLLLALCLLITSASYAQPCFYEPVRYTDPHEMVLHLQRVINTSTNPFEIVEAERLIREVYGPQCNNRYWKQVKYTVAGVVSFLALLKVTDHHYASSVIGTGAVLAWMAFHEK